MTVRSLREADIPGAMRLSTQAGWNQLAADWRRLVTLWPQHCYAILDGQQLVATGTLAVYDGRIGWIGMILVDESHRGQGLGGMMMDHLIHVADDAGIAHLGLDATDQGRAVYVKRGFVDQFEMVRCTGSPVMVDSSASRRFRHEDWANIECLDRSAVGVSRIELLRHMAGEGGAVLRVIDSSEETHIRAYGIARPGRVAGHIGPIVADDPAHAATTFDALVSDLTAGGCGSAMIDLPVESALMPHVASRGFSIARRLTRMSRPPRSSPLLYGPRVHAAFGFELG